MTSELGISIATLIFGLAFNLFPKRQSKSRGCNGNAKFGDHVFEKSYSHVKSSFLKHDNQTGIGIARPFSEMALNAFWKRAFQIYKELFYKSQYTNLTFTLETHLDWGDCIYPILEKSFSYIVYKVYTGYIEYMTYE